MSSTPRIAEKVLLIGWDAADWTFISPLLDAGKMPALSALIDRGVMGNIATLQPSLSPLLWTSIATGKFADKHGILGFIEPDGSGGVRASTSTSRKTKALWNILTQNKLKSHAIGWFASHPVEPINGVCISNQFDQNPPPPNEPWPLPEGSVHPPKWHDPARDFRVRPTELSRQDMRAFIPRIEEIDLRSDRRPIDLATALAHCTSIHALTTAILENEPWDFLAVYYDLIDAAGHHFMPYHPPQMNHISRRDFELYSQVMEQVYLFHDQMLARLIDLAGPGVTVVLVSDHGFHSGNRRPQTIPNAGAPEATAAAWHRQFGILCIAGPGIKPDERVYGATLLDVTPTVLMLLGIPPGRDMDGRPLTQILEKPVTIEPIPSWDEQPGDAGMHPSEMRIDPVASQATVDHLVSLGYLEASAADAQNAPRVAMEEAELNLAVVYMNSMRPAQAIPVLERLVQANPNNGRYALTLASAFGHAGRAKDGRAVLESLEKRGFSGPELDTMMAAALFDSGDLDAAEARLHRARAAAPESANIDATLAQIHVARGDWKNAAAVYRQMLQSDPESPQANDGLAGVLIELKDYENAASHALDALQVAYHFPMAHYHLGLAFEGMGEIGRAIKALDYAVSIVPSFREAHRRLAALHQKSGDPVRALKHERAAAGHVVASEDL